MIKRLASCLVLPLLFVRMHAACAEDVFPGPYVAGAAVKIDVGTYQFTSDADGAWLASFSAPGANSLRVRLAIPANEPTYESINIINESGVVVDTIAIDPSSAGTTVWTVPVLGPRIAVVVKRSSSDPSPPGIRVDHMAAEVNTAAVETHIGPNQMQRISEYSGEGTSKVRDIERAVGKLSFIKNDVSYVCTAFLVAEGVAMTNEHCVSDADVCRSTVMTMDYEYDNFGFLREGEDFKCTGIVDKDESLDFALLAIEGSPGRKYGTVRFAQHDLTENTSALIIQHPGGAPKMISAVDCVALSSIVAGRDAGTDYAHTCDTEGGSSGSPVFSYSGSVIALHHFGASQVNPAFQSVNRGVAITKTFLDRLAKNGIN
ncbi:trypsin-like peptidase domain-containing protein [Mesorhizobium sp. M0142]|uniref:trypsin-like peptidase domain-containing protein n=1 Tax=unclassified Mesorhizobium TaxID=325217 RepID=UPI00333D55D7